MKIVILGCGAMGSVYAALLKEVGHDVWAVDLWDDHITMINRKGLHLSGASGDRIVRGIHGTTDITEALPADLVILATKADGVRMAAGSLGKYMGAQTLVLAMQNGIGAVDILQEVIPKDRILIGIAKGFGASLSKAGHCHHHAMAEIRIGEPEGGKSSRAQFITDIWNEAGFNAHLYPDIDRLIWEKFVGNVTLSAPCTVFNVTVGELREQADLWQIALGCGREAHSIGLAKGVQFGFADPVPFLMAYTEGVLDARPSMSLDHRMRRKSEIDFINGKASSLGAALHLPTPFNDCMSAVIRDRERFF